MNEKDYTEAVDGYFGSPEVSERDAWYVLLTNTAERTAFEVSEAFSMARDPEYDHREMLKAVRAAIEAAKEHINEL